VNPVGLSRTARAERTAAASAALAERDLGTIENPAADLRAAVDLLAEAPARVEVGRTDADTALWTVAGIRHAHMSVATRTDMEIHLRTGGSVTSLVEDLPPREPGRGASVSVAAADFQRARDAAAAKGSWAFQEVLDDAGVHPTDAATLALAVEDSSSGGMVAAVRRDDTDAWQHAPLRFSWRDTTSGRYAIQQDGAWVTVTPADSARVASMADRVLGQLSG
jgi:ESX secretion-associated protein EspG